MPPGGTAYVVTPMGGTEVLDEGDTPVVPFSQVENYDLRSQEQNEDLMGMTADGGSVIARSSLVTYRIEENQVPFIAERIGPDYYRVLIEPLLRSTVRRIFAMYRWNELDSDHIIEAQKRITAWLASRLRPDHLILESVEMREVAIASPKAYDEVVETEVGKQTVLKARKQVEVARKQAQALQVIAHGIDVAHRLVAPTLSKQVLNDSERRAWSQLLMARSSDVRMIENTDDSNSSAIVEVTP